MVGTARCMHSAHGNSDHHKHAAGVGSHAEHREFVMQNGELEASNLQIRTISLISMRDQISLFSHQGRCSPPVLASGGQPLVQQLAVTGRHLALYEIWPLSGAGWPVTGPGGRLLVKAALLSTDQRAFPEYTP